MAASRPFSIGPGATPNGYQLPWGKILLIVSPFLLIILLWVFWGFLPKPKAERPVAQATISRPSGRSAIEGLPTSAKGVALNGHEPLSPTIITQPAAPPADTLDKDALIDQLTRDNKRLADRLKSQAQPQPTATRGADVDPAIAEQRAEAKKRAEERRKEEEHARQTFIFWKAGKSDSAGKGTIGLQSPVSPLMLSTGWKINCVLEHDVNSDIPGTIVARTLSPVYDSITGEVELIPPGSTTYGKQQGQAIFGQRRIPATVSHISLPDGSGLKMSSGGMMHDASGQAGIPGEVDNHWGTFLVSMFLTSALKLGTQSMANSYGADIEQQLGANVGQEAATQGGQRARQVLNSSPTIHAKRGDGCLMILDQDVPFSPQAAAQVQP